MKRCIVSIVFVLAATGLVFAGGQSEKPATTSAPQAAPLSWAKTSDPALKSQQVTVLTWNQGTPEQDKALLDRFTKETGIPLQLIDVGYDSVYNKVTLAAAAKTSDIDVAVMDTIWAGQYYAGNIAVDLTNIVPADVKSQFTNASLSSVEYDNHLMGIPNMSSTKHFYWNTALLKQAGISGPPKTYEQFLADSKTIQQKLGGQGIYASAWSWKQAEGLTCDYVSLVGAFGGTFFDSQGNPAFNKGGGLEALQYMIALMKSGTVNPASLQWSENDVANAFEAGKVAMMSNWDGMATGWNDPSKSKIANQWDVGLMPGHGNVVSAAVTGSSGFAIMKNSSHQQAALAFLKWVGSKGYQIPAYNEESIYPSLSSMYSDPALTNSAAGAMLPKYAAQFQYGVNRPNAPGYVQWSDIINAELHKALLGQGTPQADLDSAVSQIKAAIKNAGG